MKAVELRELTPDELVQREMDLKRKLFNLRFQRASGELDNSAELTKTRKDIARLMTIITERRLGASGS
ncbi:50S ribosomal protein L29 [Candidatus Bipolaricaulota bacterium]|jgi:large subunit ribosomal protein L29|nr:50S ribosomal protein L29 [Candidatus Bipolaricaulota bacterium]TFH11688.1 MAG: 50S ribosomal protein L29 [Candidatus Atribacteria bacterium]